MKHFKNTCPVCGTVTQCKCIGPHTETSEPCERCKAAPTPKTPAHRTLSYVAHPVGALTRDGVMANVARAQRWLRWLILSFPDVSFVVPWMPYVMVLDDHDPAQRARGMADGAEVLTRCDRIDLVGGDLTTGMEAELRLAMKLGHRVENHLKYGPEPPAIETVNTCGTCHGPHDYEKHNRELHRLARMAGKI